MSDMDLEDIDIDSLGHDTVNLLVDVKYKEQIMAGQIIILSKKDVLFVSPDMKAEIPEIFTRRGKFIMPFKVFFKRIRELTTIP